FAGPTFLPPSPDFSPSAGFSTGATLPLSLPLILSLHLELAGGPVCSAAPESRRPPPFLPAGTRGPEREQRRRPDLAPSSAAASPVLCSGGAEGPDGDPMEEQWPRGGVAEASNRAPLRRLLARGGMGVAPPLSSGRVPEVARTACSLPPSCELGGLTSASRCAGGA
ncbi:unnamed protein product, partial [Urochloa humidicola]